MGLSSSQARLLNLTTRMHQIEYKAAKLESQKLQMANESRQVYQEYENALEKTKIQIKTLNTDGSVTYRDLKSLDDMMNSGFTLVVHDVPIQGTREGAIQVEENGKKYVYEPANYDPSSGETYYKANLSSITGDSTITFTEISNQGTQGQIIRPGSGNIVDTGVGTTLSIYYTRKQVNDNGDVVGDDGFAKIATSKDKHTKTSDIVCRSVQDLEDALNAKYYDNTANGTTASGEFKVSGVNFETLLTNLMNMGDVTIAQKMENGEWPNPLSDGKEYSFSDYQSSVATNTSFQEVTDETGLRKAEAKYEADMKRIDNKDTKYDYDLAALDNERNAIKQEMETLQTVAKDNVDRTFKLFS